MTFDIRGGIKMISSIAGAAAAKMAAQRCSGILYGVRLNRSRTAWSSRRLTSRVMTAPSSRVSTICALRVGRSLRR